MRAAYQDQLEQLVAELASMCDAAATAIDNATISLLEADLQLAEQVISGDVKLDDARTHVEEQAYSLLALQAPVAKDLRTVLAVLHAAESVERMGDLALHVAKVARRRHPQSAITDVVRPYFADMGEIAVNLARQTAEVIRNRDVAAAHLVEDADDAMDDLHRQLFTVIMDMGWRYGIAAAVDVTLLSRFYERFADHAVSVAKRTVFVVTGKMPTNSQET